MSDHTHSEALIAQLENLWGCFDDLFDSFSTDDWQRKHGADWTLADVPYHLAYFDHEMIAYPLAAGSGLPEKDRMEIDSVAALQRWNASQFARRSAYSEPDKAVARWRTTRAEMIEQLRALSDADLEQSTWLALTPARGWRTTEYVCTYCIAHGWNEFMELRHYAERETPDPAPAVTHSALAAFIGLYQSLLDPEAAGDVDFTLVWEISGPGGGSWTTRVADGKASLSEGDAAEADLTLRMSPLQFVLWWNGKIDLSEATANGQISVSDPKSLATFNALFPSRDPDVAWPIAF